MAKSPASNSLLRINSKSPELGDEERARFNTFCAKLLHLGYRTRPEIQMATSYLSTRVTVATKQDANKLDRVMKYLNNTRGAGLILEGASKLVVRAFTGAAHGIHEDGKGHQGLFITLGMGPVMTMSRKQKVQCESSTESKLVALSDHIKQVEWVKDYLEEQGLKTGPAFIYQDDTTSMAEVKQDSHTSKDRKKHFKKRRLLVKDSVDEKIIKLKYLPTEAMVADIT